ncbi:hypothetical protein TSOC_006080, partial [Tetrabaena socialis]
MGLAVYFATPVLCAILFRHFVRQPIGSIFLEGLYAYLPHEASITPPPGAKASKRDRKLLQKRQIALKGASQSVVAQQLSPSALSHLNSEPSTFGAALETLGVLVLVLLVGLAVHLTFGPLFGMWQDVLMWSLGPLIVLWAAAQLLLLEGNGSLTKLMGSKWHVTALGALCAAAAYAALVLAPAAGWLPWDVHAAAKDMDELVNVSVRRLLARRLKEFKPPPPFTSDPNVLAVAIAVLAGILGEHCASGEGRGGVMAGRGRRHPSRREQWAATRRRASCFPAGLAQRAVPPPSPSPPPPALCRTLPPPSVFG